MVMKNAATGRSKTDLPALYDELEAKIRALERRVRTQEKYGDFLSPLVESCLPEEALVAWERSRNHSLTETKESRILEQLMNFLRQEVKGEEMANLARTGFASHQSSQRRTNSFRESLVDIILSKDEVNRSSKDDENNVKLGIQKHWKQLCNNHCVLCWTFSNVDDRTIYNPVLNMWISNQHIQCFQRVTVHKSHTFSVDDEFQKEIKPKENFTVTVSFEIPEFSCENLAVEAVLSWYIGSNAEFENELYLPLKEKILAQQQMCLQTNISSDEIFTSGLIDISTYEDLMCVKILQQRSVFIILSLMTDLCNFGDLVISSCPSNNLLLLMSSGTKILVFNKANHPLYGAHIAFKTVSQASVEVEVFTKNEKETALVEKYLYQRLPSDVLILANGISSDESIQLKQQAVCCMKDELDLLLSMLNIHNVQGPAEKFDVQPGTVVISKEKFLRIRKALLKKECRTDNVMQILSRINFFRKNE
ncbi:hypothetical protein AVEN_213716-1 [Araneus ventricosus]|uniref:Uncharacterized protein n=1 Tax=Araneus ventricosus TaxID=182803 RepID=A0A4Y2GNB3_ARAVE|nr:hypothetical protein AVEN_213716-1 [Araneus ventricosus]